MSIFSARNSEEYKMMKICDIWSNSSDNSVFLVYLSLFSRPENHPKCWKMYRKTKLTKSVKVWGVLHLKFGRRRKRHLLTYCSRNQESARTARLSIWANHASFREKICSLNILSSFRDSRVASPWIPRRGFAPEPHPSRTPPKNFFSKKFISLITG